MLISRDLDCTNTMYVQFSLRFIAKGKSFVWVEFIISLQKNSPLPYTIPSPQRNDGFEAHKFCCMGELT